MGRKTDSEGKAGSAERSVPAASETWVLVVPWSVCTDTVPHRESPGRGEGEEPSSVEREKGDSTSQPVASSPHYPYGHGDSGHPPGRVFWNGDPYSPLIHPKIRLWDRRWEEPEEGTLLRCRVKVDSSFLNYTRKVLK